MAPEMIQSIVGLSFTVFCIISIFINCTVLYALYKSRLPCINPLYILTAFTIGTCTIRMLITGFTWGPAVFLDRNIIGDNDVGWFSYLTTYVIVVLWAEGAVTQVFIALNRLFTMRDMACRRFFSRKACIIYVIAVVPSIGAFQHVVTTMMPCCKYYFIPHLYSPFPALRKGDEPNIVFDYIYRPMNFACYSIPVVCYLMIFAQVYASNKNRAAWGMERRKETRRTLHFAYTFMFYLDPPKHPTWKKFPSLGDTFSKRDQARQHKHQKPGNLPISECFIASADIFAQVYASNKNRAAWGMERRKETTLYITLEIQQYIPPTMPILNALMIYFAICDCTSMALIQGLMNSNIRQSIRRGRNFRASVTPSAKETRPDNTSTKNQETCLSQNVSLHQQILFTMRDMACRRFFSRKACIIYVIAVVPSIGTFQHVVTTMMPCCKYYFIPHLYSPFPALRKGDEPNIVFDYIYRPMNLACYSIPVVCYLMIFAQVYASNKNRAAWGMERRKETNPPKHPTWKKFPSLGDTFSKRDQARQHKHQKPGNLPISECFIASADTFHHARYGLQAIFLEKSVYNLCDCRRTFNWYIPARRNHHDAMLQVLLYTSPVLSLSRTEKRDEPNIVFDYIYRPMNLACYSIPVVCYLMVSLRTTYLRRNWNPWVMGTWVTGTGKIRVNLRCALI
ncbi:Serpentine Receptor, class X [Ditylenchus destructor]|nr:Serpentine Receptor, class X [Ditylenchus destructor]